MRRNIGTAWICALALLLAGTARAAVFTVTSPSDDFGYKDPLAASDGVTRIAFKSGAAGGGSLALRAANAVSAGRTEVPTGGAAHLQGANAATVQVSSSGGSCFGVVLDTVTRSGNTWFKAKP